MCLNPQCFKNPTAIRLLAQRCSYITLNGSYYNGDDIYNDSRFALLNRDDNNHIVDCPEAVQAVCDSTFVHFGKCKSPLFIKIPCGKCKICQDSRRRDIENRMLFEASDFPTMVFFTLTYDDLHLPFDGLHSEHVSDFLKRFRTSIERAANNHVWCDVLSHKSVTTGTTFGNHVKPYELSLTTDYKFRSVFCGEYGADHCKTRRPHYHGILFFDRSLNPKDIYKLSCLFISKWTHGYIYDFTLCKNPAASARYITKYITKCDNQNVPQGKNPTFFRTPRKVGLGAAKLSEHKEAILNSKSGTIWLKFNNSVRRVKIPSFLLRKLFPSLSTFCPSCSLKLHLIELFTSELSKRYYDIGCCTSFCNQIYYDISYLDYVQPRLLRKSTRNTFRLISWFVTLMSDMELFNSLELLRSDVLRLPTADEYFGILSDKSDYIDQLELPDISITQRLFEKVNIAQSNLNYVNDHLMCEKFDLN